MFDWQSVSEQHTDGIIGFLRRHNDFSEQNKIADHAEIHSKSFKSARIKFTYDEHHSKLSIVLEVNYNIKYAVVKGNQMSSTDIKGTQTQTYSSWMSLQA